MFPAMERGRAGLGMSAAPCHQLQDSVEPTFTSMTTGTWSDALSASSPTSANLWTPTLSARQGKPSSTRHGTGFPEFSSSCLDRNVCSRVDGNRPALPNSVSNGPQDQGGLTGSPDSSADLGQPPHPPERPPDTAAAPAPPPDLTAEAEPLHEIETPHEPEPKPLLAPDTAAEPNEDPPSGEPVDSNQSPTTDEAAGSDSPPTSDNETSNT
jgi:hypothetical protein